MNKYPKGINTRERIVNSAREIFNEYGIGITLSILASKLGITLGMLTYHFPTKDSIFLAIAEDYEQKRVAQRVRDYGEKLNLSIFYKGLGNTMDIQYDYRCAMRYIASISNNQSELSNHTIDRYKLNRKLISQAIQALVSEGELKDTILDRNNFKVFLFTFSSLLTSWLINLEIYDNEVSYKKMKPIYLNGIFLTCLPFCTEQGEELLRKFGVIK